MPETVYDRNASFYLAFVDRGLASGNYERGLAILAACLGDRLTNASVCDLCCGEGYLGRWLVAQGAREVIGVDNSTALVAAASARSNSDKLSYLVEDAARLTSLADGRFDVVVSQLAMMDVADHRRLFAAVKRVLAPGGPFVFSMLHPCFMPPCHAADAPPLVVDEEGRPVAVAVRRYATEGHWNSGGDGVRGRMGQYHRTVSTYVNDLIAAGFVIERLEEPLAGDNWSGTGLAGEVPTVLIIAARSSSE
jgi:2-polyprenyl-3-methyl-5-hydroxy-6-metoxy-1,4-benzoquinol methylase